MLNNYKFKILNLTQLSLNCIITNNSMLNTGTWVVQWLVHLSSILVHGGWWVQVGPEVPQLPSRRNWHLTPSGAWKEKQPDM